jgi:hypothetical protein
VKRFGEFPEEETSWPGPPLDRPGDKTCKHFDHQVSAKIFRMVDEEDHEKVTGWASEIRIRCAHCGIPFEWIGLEAGMMPDKPMCDLHAIELRAPIKPLGSLVMAGVPGYKVRVQ